MTRKLVYTEEAIKDLRAIATYITQASANRAVASGFVGKLRTSCQRLADLPGTLGTDRSDLRAGIRSTPYRNYIILFRYAGDAVEVVNVLHASRDVRAYYDEV